MNLSIIDTHAHLNLDQFQEDCADVIIRAKAVGVNTIVTVGIDKESSLEAIRLADIYPEVLATVGFHPHEAASVEKADIDKLAEMAEHPRVIAIGEIGLDFYRNISPREKQFQSLRWQLELTSKLDLPVIIHCRQAEKEILPILQNWASSHKRMNSKPIGVIHCFSGDIKTAQCYLDMGFYIAFGAYIGYPSSAGLRDVIRFIPADRYLVETDCPFLAPQKYRGKRNEPSYLPLTVKVLADIRKTSQETVAIETTQNACNLFDLPELE